MKSISSRELGFVPPVTGLESVLSLPVVQEYLAAKQLRAETLLPGWKGWDTPHLLDMRRGAIKPTSPDMLREDAEKWKAEGGKSWPCNWPFCECSKHFTEQDREFCKSLFPGGGKT